MKKNKSFDEKSDFLDEEISDYDEEIISDFLEGLGKSYESFDYDKIELYLEILHKALSLESDRAERRLKEFVEIINELESKVDSGILECEIIPEGVRFGLSSKALENEIKNTSNIEQFLKENKELLLSQSLPEYLNMILERKGLKRADVVRGSLLDRVYVYQIFSGLKKPSRDKLIAIAFGLGLSADETQKMLKLSGNRELYAKDERDVIILFSLQRGKNIFETNDLLHSYNFKVLGITNLDD